jgi:trimethylamine--corrinoid protein Co-methyltransferase
MDDKYRLNIPRVSILSKEKLELIHLSTLEVLRRTGVQVDEPSAVEIFKKGGCYVDGDRVRIPAHLVEWALRNTPPRVSMCDRNGKPAMFLEENNVYFGTGSDTPNVVDAYSGQRRIAVLQDIANNAKVVDYLDEMSFIMCMGIASDVNESISDLYHYEAMVSHSVKPIIFTAWSLENLKAIIEMAEVVAGGEEQLRRNPHVALYTEPVSPLMLAKESTQKIMFMAEKSLPVVFTPGLVTGGTGPVTMAGGIVQGNAEVLAGHVLANLVKEGAPFIYGGAIVPMDMSTSLIAYAAPELMLAMSAITDLARYYRLPMFSLAGASDSNLYDQQASLESAVWILLSSLSGGNLVHDVGYINNGLTASLQQLVVSNEVIGMVRRMYRGIDVDEETLALDLIDEVGPGGEFLTSEHTLRHFRENWYSDLIQRIPYEKWVDEGRKDLGARASEKAREILENHQPTPLDENVQKELRKIIASMESVNSKQ